MRKVIGFCVLLGSLIPAGALLGQAGVSSMSYGALKTGIQLHFNEIRIEEIVNYHRHSIPLPEKGTQVQLSSQVAGNINGKSVFQIGVATLRAIDRKSARPLNLVLVIDRSGSMSGERIDQVKQAMRTFVESLRPKDSVAIVSFSDEARTDLESCGKSDLGKILKAIDRLEANGSTNLHAGLMSGYRIAKSKFDDSKSNRVILLTDGIANRGVTNENQIARESSRFNKKGIDLSTIGLGYDFNRDLLRKLAYAGRGAVHFVGDCKDIQKTFVAEVDSLLSPAARNVRLTLDFANCQSVPKLFGYETSRSNDSQIELAFENLNCGATQVVVGEMAKPTGSFEVRLKYVDALTGETTEICREIHVDRDETDGIPDDLKKNYAIAKLAKAVKNSAKYCEESEYRRAQKKLKKAVSVTRSQFERGADEDVDRLVTLARDRGNQILSAVQATKKNHLRTGF